MDSLQGQGLWGYEISDEFVTLNDSLYYSSLQSLLAKLQSNLSMVNAVKDTHVNVVRKKF